MLKYPLSRERITLICSTIHYFGTVSLVPTAQNCSHKLWSFNPGATNGTSPAPIYWGILSTDSRRSLAGTNAESRWAVNDLGWAQKHLLLPALQSHGDDVWTIACSPHSSRRSNNLCHVPSLFTWDFRYESSLLYCYKVTASTTRIVWAEQFQTGKHLCALPQMITEKI